MSNLILKDLVPNTGSNDAGLILYKKLETAHKENEIVILHIEATQSLSSSFLNSSIGMYLEKFGIESFKETVKFRGNKIQFRKLSDYIALYSKLGNVVN